MKAIVTSVGLFLCFLSTSSGADIPMSAVIAGTVEASDAELDLIRGYGDVASCGKCVDRTGNDKSCPKVTKNSCGIAPVCTAFIAKDCPVNQLPVTLKDCVGGGSNPNQGCRDDPNSAAPACGYSQQVACKLSSSGNTCVKDYTQTSNACTGPTGSGTTCVTQ